MTTVDHGFRSESGVNYFKTVTTNPENDSSTVLTDARELTVKSIDAMGGVTRLEYDAMGQLTHSYDPDNFLTSYQYDMQGNLTQRIHPDAGTTMYEYDPAGHLTRETNPLGQIFYHYTYYRLAHKRYSDMTENNVTYSYGDVGRATGRPVRIVDGSGVQTFEYDALGNVSKSIRVLSVPASGYAYAFTHNFEYDSWGRIWSMTYPDGERVDYRYNHAGDLTLMTGDKWGNPRTYIADILYTKYGQRKRIDYGNGTHTEYAYDSLQRLAFLHSEDISHNPMQHTEYSYNKVGNITGLANNAGGIGGMGGLYSNSYYYDPLGRLVASNGSGDIGGQPRNYTMEEMQYSPSGRIGTKHLLWQSVTTRGIQHMEYFYSNSNDKPHAPRLIVNNATGGLYDLVWDGAGNLVRMAVRNEPAVDYSNRILHWTEDNRLFAVADESHFSYYAYDHNGERTLKMTGDAATVDQNALEQHVFTSLNHVTLYPSPYIVLTEQGYTKHYYAGADRLAARMGSGGLSRDTSCVRSNENLVRRTDELFRHSCERVNSFNYRNHEELELVRIDGSIFDSVFEFDRNAASRHLYADVKPRPGAIHNLIVSHSTHNTRSAPTPEEPDVYFYHSDHLGSASWITNAAGMPIQHLQYLPFGERFVDQRSTGYSERFTFTGKERDEETGYGYFGARYMDHELMTMWLSVDPLADKYPSISPYAYCAWNPVKLIDPDGQDTVDVSFNGNKWELSNHKIARGNDVIRVYPGGDKPPESYVFSDGQYGNRKCNLRLSKNGEEVLSVYLLSGQEKNGVGFQVERCMNVKDNTGQTKSTLIPEGSYSISGSDYMDDRSTARYPGFITTNVKGYSGVRSHYQMKDIASYRYSKACQIIGGSSYELIGGHVMLGALNTINASCEVARYFGAESPNATRRLTNDSGHPFQVYWNNTQRVSQGCNIFKRRAYL